jgi:hypothetical protein
VLIPGRLEGNRPARGTLSRLPDENRARGSGRLQPARGIDEVARDHPLVGRPEGDGGFAGEDAGPGCDAGSERLDRVDELKAGPNCPLGVVFVRRGRTPDGHDGVADELLDGSPVATDHVPREVEIASQELTSVLGIASLGECREADEVGEQDGDEAALGDGGRDQGRDGRP